MIIQEILFGVNIVSLVLAIIAIIFIAKAKQFEKENGKLILNLILIGLFFIIIVIAYDSLLSLQVFEFANKLKNLPLNIISVVIELMIVPIAALSFLVGLLHLRETKQ